eukprot:scaffold49394_cov22-Tisochrysis_lutea.AAC.3
MISLCSWSAPSIKACEWKSERLWATIHGQAWACRLESGDHWKSFPEVYWCRLVHGRPKEITGHLEVPSLEVTGADWFMDTRGKLQDHTPGSPFHGGRFMHMRGFTGLAQRNAPHSPSLPRVAQVTACHAGQARNTQSDTSSGTVAMIA